MYNKYNDDDEVFVKKFNKRLKEVCRIRRKGSPYTVIFQIDPINYDDDYHFILCSFTKKDGTVDKQYTFCKQDVGTFLHLLINCYNYDEPEWNEDYDTNQINNIFKFNNK